MDTSLKLEKKKKEKNKLEKKKKYSYIMTNGLGTGLYYDFFKCRAASTSVP